MTQIFIKETTSFEKVFSKITPWHFMEENWFVRKGTSKQKGFYWEQWL